MDYLIICFVISCMVSSPLFAEVDYPANKVEMPATGQPTPSEETPNVTQAGQPADQSSRSLRGRANVYLAGNYAYLDLILPSKYGITGEWLEDVDHAWGFEYLRASISLPIIVGDLGGFTEERFSVTRRFFLGQNSLNLFWLLAYNKVNLDVGSSILASIPESDGARLSVISTETLAAGGGIGHRWQHRSGLTWGVDWFVWTQPLYTIRSKSGVLDRMTDAADKDRVRKAISVMNYFPRWSIAKLQAGYSF